MVKPLHTGIVVLGTPRSGTTLLRRVLGAHPEIASMGESNLLGACARFLESERIAEDVEIGVLAGLGHAGFAREEVLARLREFAFAFHRDHAARMGKPRWVEKTAFDAFHVEPHRGAVRRSRVLPVRDPSRTRRRLQPAGAVGKEWRLPARAARLRQAASAAARGLCPRLGGHDPRNPRLRRAPSPKCPAAALRGPGCQPVRHPLRTHSASSASRSTRPCSRTPRAGPATSASATGRPTRAATIGPESVGRWKSLSRWTIGQLGAIANETLVECGYEPVPVEAARESGEARRRYELGLLLGRARKGSEDKS